jgi:proline iminopeptidase
MYPPLQAHASGWLAAGGGHRVFWEQCGHPLGLPALFVHSGPGAGSRPEDRRWFDPQRYRIVLFDQRGAGRSQPPGRTAHNRTAHLLDDMERLRRHLGIERWLLLGGSWGATLALAYAQRHPQRVAALVLRAPFMATARELRWLYGPSGAALHEPAAWRRFCLEGQFPLGVLRQQLRSGQQRLQQQAARTWWQWEQALDRAEDAPEHRLDLCALNAAVATARIGLHYARHGFWLNGDRLLRRAERLAGIPGVILQGARDQITPGFSAARLNRAWSGSKLRLLPDTGHASSEPAMAYALVEATDGFAMRAQLWNSTPAVQPGNGSWTRSPVP